MTSPIPITDRHICSVAHLSAALDVDRTTIHTWLGEDMRLRSCTVRINKRKIYFSVEKLMQAGILRRPVKDSQPLPALTAHFSVPA